MAQVRVKIGKNDKTGADICIGDTLAFDAMEWYRDARVAKKMGPHVFTITLENGKLSHDGAAGDFSTYCTVIGRGVVEGEVISDD